MSRAQRVQHLPERDENLDCHCFHCGRDFPGSDRAGGHCSGCHCSFRSNAGFNKHRVGRHELGKRRCLTEDEMAGKGWTCSNDGNHIWRLPDTGNYWASQSNKGKP